jgi:hypothetical protein
VSSGDVRSSASACIAAFNSLGVIFAGSCAKIDQPLRADLHAMRGVRNFFAHSTKRETLSAEKPQKFLKMLSTYKSDRDPLLVFLDAFTKCSDAFAPAEERTALVKAILSYKPK